jgi:hypothetical protein
VIRARRTVTRKSIGGKPLFAMKGVLAEIGSAVKCAVRCRANPPISKALEAECKYHISATFPTYWRHIKSLS